MKLRPSMGRMGRRDLLTGGGLVALGLAGGGIGLACEKSSALPPDRGKILTDLSNLVIVPAYAAAQREAAALQTSLAGLRAAPTLDTLTAARAAWRKARAAWKTTDAFLFGPADDLAITGGSIDTLADAVKVEAFASATSEGPPDAAAVGKLGANQRGFPALEVLLFDALRDDGAVVASFTAGEGRRGIFAATLGAELAAKIDAVHRAWTGDFAEQLATAGRGSRVYAAERQGVDAVVNALIAAAEVLIAVRLAKPLGIDKSPAAPAPELLESPRSDASIDDLVAVLDGIDMVYLGRGIGGVGLPLADAVAERTPRGDQVMRTNLVKARAAVVAIPGPLRTAIVEHRDPAIQAHAAVREVKRTLVTDVAAALGTSVGFNVTDGD